jgi:hypothetical protein
MSTQNLKNISINEFKAFLELVLCKFITIKGGHEKWTRTDLNRPIIFQTHINPIPEFIIKNNLRVLNYSKNDYFDIINGKKEVVKEGETYILREIK